ncbi:hypothetical protein AAHE18_09G128400 [Arachis hypogaea]
MLLVIMLTIYESLGLEIDYIFLCFAPLSKQGRRNEQRANRVKMKRTYHCFRINEFHICMNFFSALVTLSKLPSLCKVSKCFNESSKRIV